VDLLGEGQQYTSTLGHETMFMDSSLESHLTLMAFVMWLALQVGQLRCK